MLNMLPSPSA